MTKQKCQKRRIVMAVAAAVIVLLGLTILRPFTWRTDAANVDLSKYDLDFSASTDDQSQYMYLSDVDPKVAKMGYGSFLKDKASNGSKISLNYDGGVLTFDKGLWAHASSNLYYDLEALGVQGVYDYLTAYVGLNATSTSGNGVIFWVYGANEWAETGSVWTVLYNSESKVSLPKADADFIKVPIEGYRYLRLQVSDNKGNSNDHSVWADAKLVKEGYSPFLTPAIEEIDAELMQLGDLDVVNNPEHELLVLRRELFKSVGQYTLTEFLKGGDANRRTLEWLCNDLHVLRLYLHGGQPAGTYAQSLQVLSDLYTEYKDDLDNKSPLVGGSAGTQGELYLKMMITLSLTHSRSVRLWVRDRVAAANGSVVNYEAEDSPNVSRPLDRYRVYKRMYLDGKLRTTTFERLEVEEMRYVMNTAMGDDEVAWLNDYLRNKGKSPTGFPSMAYRSAGYWHAEDFAEENQAAIINSWWLNDPLGNYNIINRAYEPHLWMVFKWGGVCWQISNTAQNMAASYGIPSTTVGQRPDHVAYSHYTMNADGDGSWGLSNDVYGWEKTDFVGYDGISSYRYSNDPMRHMNDWGFAYDKRAYAYRYNMTYLMLAQEAINHYEDYEDADALTMLADLYEGDYEKREEIYRRALEIQPVNLDAWLGLIFDYKARYSHETAAVTADSNGATLDSVDQLYLELADEVVAALHDHPVPMYDMLRKIRAELQHPAAITQLDMLQTKTLTETGQTSACKTWRCRMARHLLGQVDNQVAVFSFDGDYAGALRLGSKYDGTDALWEYSLDGGNTWSDQIADTHSVQLTAEQLASLTVENDIKVHIMGIPRIEANIYTIDLTQASLGSKNLYANDQENRVMGVDLTMEWREVTLNEDGSVATAGDWVPYRTSSPLRTGDVTIQVRIGATGTQLPSEPSSVYAFTQDPETNLQRVYVPVSHLSVAAVSSQATANSGNAVYAIDGNPNTRWHSAWNGTDKVREYTVKFDHTVKLSAFEYMSAGGGNGRLLEVDFYGSMDGNEFTLIGKVSSNCEGATVPCSATWPTTDNMVLRTFEFGYSDENGEFSYAPVELNYLKIHGVTTTPVNSSNSFMTARMFKFYEDRTEVADIPTGSVAYSEIVPTREDVVARLTNLSAEVEITSQTNTDDPYTYIFSENGSFTFTFIDHATGKTGQAIATVDWIYKNMNVQPTIEYTCAPDAFSGTVSGVDCSGLSGKINRSVMAKLVFPEDQTYTIISGEDADFADMQGTPDEGDLQLDYSNTENDYDDDQGSNQGGNTDPYSYLFMENGSILVRYRDEAGNEGAVRVVVDWIDKVPPTAIILYSTTEETDGEVVAKVVRPSEVGNDGGEGEADTQTLGRAADSGDEVDEFFYVTNNNGSYEYTFTENGSFVFNISDRAGNETAVMATVDWIKPKTEQPDQPDNPDVPENPDRPTPDTPDTPSNPDNPPTVTPEPSNPGENRPSDSGSGDQNTGVSTGTNNGSSNSTSDNQVADNTGATSGNSSSTSSTQAPTVGETVGLPENATASTKRLVLTSQLSAQFGSNSEYFSLKFVDSDGNEIEDVPESIQLTVSTTKKLLGVYRVKEDGTTEKVDYIQDGDKITMQSPMAGDYLLDYEEVAADVSGKKDEDEEVRTPWYQSPIFLWGIGGVAAVAVIGIGAAMYNNRRRP